MDDAWVISDLHLGAGDRPGLESFRDDALLVQWIEGRDLPTTLVINGDFIEFLKIPTDRASHDLPSWALWDEPTSVEKLERCVDAHAAVFDALGDFRAAGGKLCFTIGNHDLDLGWPAVQERLRERLGDTSGAIAVELQHTLFDRVHVEHGHRFTGENRPRDFENFIHEVTRDGRAVRVLECVWGSRFVLDALLPLEFDHPYIDNVKPTWKLAVRMLAGGEWLAGRRAETLLDLIRFFRRTGVPWSDIGDGLTDWATVLRPGNLERAFPDPADEDWRSLVLKLRAAAPAELEAAFDALSTAEEAELSSPKAIVIGEPVGLHAATPAALDRGQRDGDDPDRPHSREVRGARDCLGRDGITAVVFGHTHDVVDGWDGALWNPGSWIEQLDTGSAEVRAKLRSKGLREVVSDASLFTTDPRAVHVTFDGTQAHVSLDAVRR